MNLTTCFYRFIGCLCTHSYIIFCGLRIYTVSGTVSIVVVSAKLGTFKVTCTATGGILSTSSLTGPGLSSEGLSLTLQGDDSRTGQNVYSATSGTLVVQSNGDEYTCNVTNDVSSSESSVKLKSKTLCIYNIDQLKYNIYETMNDLSVFAHVHACLVHELTSKRRRV